MKINPKNNKILVCLIAPFIIGALLLVVYAIHGVYPFGTNTISYYDMSQSFVPLYYHTWDVLHGVKKIYFDWNVGMGCAMTDVTGAFLFCPSNLFFLFVKRSNILNSLSFFLLLKMMLAAFSMSFYIFDKYEKKMMCIYAGIAYASCGYILQFYTNIYFLDTVMLFPLLIMELEKVIRGKRKLPYILLLFLTFLTNQQMVFMVVIYIILKGWMLIRGLEKSDRGRAIAELIICSLIGAMLSGFSFIPSFICMSQSQRFGNATSNGMVEILKELNCDFQEQKIFMLFGGEIGIGCLIYVLCRKKEKIKLYFDSVVMIVMLATPIVLENSNLLWHGGSYQHFPMRFGYMLSFELIILVVRVVTELEQEQSKEEKTYQQYLLYFGIALIPLIMLLLVLVCGRFRFYGIRVFDAYVGYGFVILAIVLFAVCIVYSKNNKLGQKLILTVAIIQASIGMYGLIAPIYDYSLECNEEFVPLADMVYQDITPEDELNRIKDRDIELDFNYGLIVNQSSIGAWMNGTSSKLQNTMKNMGYSASLTRIIDGGGTAFSDALLGIKRLYSIFDVNDDLYYNGKTAGVGTIYDCKYSVPFGFIITDIPKGQGFEYQNSLFRAASGLQKDYIEEFDIVSNTKSIQYDEEIGANVYDIVIPVEERAVLYLYAEAKDENKYMYTFAINDQQLILDGLGTEDNVMYSTFYMNGMLELGTYEDEQVDLKVITAFDSLDDIHVGLMKMDIFQEGIEIINNYQHSESYVDDGRIIMNYSADRKGTLVLPIGYNENYVVNVDGEKIGYYPIMDDAFVGIELTEGEHTIELWYEPAGLVVGWILTILGITFCTIIILFRKTIKYNEKVSMMLVMLYNVVLGAMILVLYLIPIIVAIVKACSTVRGYGE